MKPDEQIEAAIEALHSVRLYSRWHRSAEPTARHAEEIAKMLEGTRERFLVAIAAALRNR